jgi:hypothetical protein
MATAESSWTGSEKSNKDLYDSFQKAGLPDGKTDNKTEIY